MGKFTLHQINPQRYKKNGYTQIKVQKNKNIFPFTYAVCAL